MTARFATFTEIEPRHFIPVSLGLGSHWLTGAMAPRAARPVLFVIEQLMALRQAALLRDLDKTKTDLEGIFYKNAKVCYNIK